MAFCSFDHSAALFDATPVENMFISEYMLRAPGDFVKVYLYGLMLCYHRAQEMSLDQMARDLDITTEEIERAFSYWERQGLVRRTGDQPPAYTYFNLKQITLSRAEKPGDQLYNRYFVEAVEKTLNQQELRPEDFGVIYSWIDDFDFPEEVVLMLLQSQKKKSRTGRVKLAYADRVAKEWARSGVRTVEDVDRIVFMGKERERQLTLLLSRLGQRRAPSDDEKEMFSYWMDEWKFTYEQILDASKETINGVPTMKYIDAVLRRRYQMALRGVSVEEERDLFQFARSVFAALGRTGVLPTQEDRDRIGEWMAQGFSQALILMAAKEAHEPNMGGNLDDVENKLRTWKENNFSSEEEVAAARLRVKALNEQLRLVYKTMGMNRRANAADRDLLERWTAGMRMDMELVLLAAQYARESGATSLGLVSKILSDWSSAGIHTLEAAKAEHEAHMRRSDKPQQTVRAQDTMLRYTPEERRATYSAAELDLDEEDV